uniref:KIB1-4 beta-propeller domain-containing protein n=1 Tax=Leersia perrieri TaxID=77586 RepID=A0A0D9XLM3_9ORYZ
MAITHYNPVTTCRVPLPTISFFKRWHNVSTTVLLADPDMATEWSALAVGYPVICLAFYCSIVNDWMPIAFNSASYACIEHFRGRLYVTFKSWIGILDLDGDVLAINPLEIAGDGDNDYSESDARDGPSPKIKWGHLLDLLDEDPPSKRIVESHLVECNGELLLMVMHVEGQYNNSKVEWVGDGAVRLLRMEDLGSFALFICRNHVFALSPKEFPTILANCVYIVEQQCQPDGLVRVVNFNDDTNEWVGDKDIFPDDGKLRCTLVGWAFRGWVLPKY